MASPTNIEWTEFNWNPLSGCSRKSAGCENCYAEKMTKRLAAMGLEKYQGLLNEQGRFNGVIKFSENDLLAPLKRKKPTTYFVNSMSDLFHEKVKDEWLDKAFAVMALTPQHTYQILTKRPERMREYLTNAAKWPDLHTRFHETAKHLVGYHAPVRRAINREDLPLKNVWLGVSVEDQKTADERIPLLLETPAAVHWLSMEPLLEHIDLEHIRWTDEDAEIRLDARTGEVWCENSDSPSAYSNDSEARIEWAVIGGESGPGARPCNIAWIRSIVGQCKGAGVPVFYKQGGSSNACQHSKKGGCYDCFPADLKIREFPHGTN